MKINKFMGMATGVALMAVAALAFAQGGAAPGGRQAGKLVGKGLAGDAARPGQGGGIQKLLAIALTAPWAKADTQTQSLVDKILADRKTVLGDDSARLAAINNLVAALRGGDENAIKTAKDAVKAASQTVKTAHEQTVTDVEALAARIKEIRPQSAAGATAPTGTEKGAGRRGQAGAQANDLPLNLY